jgi:hypothetical protein
MNFTGNGITKSYPNKVTLFHNNYIEFSLDENDAEPVMTICNIIELSNHYK